MQSKSHRAVKGIKIMSSFNIKHDTCSFNLIGMLPRTTKHCDESQTMETNEYIHILLYKNLKICTLYVLYNTEVF